MRSRARNKARIAVLDARLQRIIDTFTTTQRAELRAYCEGKLAATPERKP